MASDFYVFKRVTEEDIAYSDFRYGHLYYAEKLVQNEEVYPLLTKND